MTSQAKQKNQQKQEQPVLNKGKMVLMTKNKRVRGGTPTKRRVPGPGAGGRRPATGGGKIILISSQDINNNYCSAF